MFLITGATGNVGRHLVAELATAGHKVRALSRDPASARFPTGVEVAATEDLPLDGVSAVFVNPAVFWNGFGDLLDRCREHGVRRVVMLSSSSTLGAGPDNPIGEFHLAAEQEIEASGLEWAFPRPGAFDANALNWAREIRAGGVVAGPYAEAATAPIHERDIAAVSAAMLTRDDLVGTRPVLSGPESLTFVDQARIIGEALGKHVRYEGLSREDARAAMLGGGHMTPEIADSLLNLWAKYVGRPAEISPEVERITGRPPRSFAEWAADNADRFA
ncbi:NAD(P)H-binding protein [Actinomadura harenae]|uniref:NAD-dependent epimerase/dehydratase family protein n=1 Tax=Actinomadura harenae TaxID=2483351 RepID=A0A3M2MA21_9ACTN|nr:NAD(P)H-binding protein [Actinomadura harenae]RMI45723.1 NAD-dependent epimerase/dehydratase family protein [Actinomadura harenae]